MNVHAGADGVFKLVLDTHNLVKQPRLIHVVEQNDSSYNFSSFLAHPLELADETAKGIVNSFGTAFIAHAFPNFIKLAHQRGR
jgi:hypothetical protein